MLFHRSALLPTARRLANNTALIAAVAALATFPIATVAHSEELTAQIAASAPTPCLDSEIPMQRSEYLQQTALAAVVGLGKGAHLSAGWAPGNADFDRAFALAFEAFQKDATVTALLRRIDAKAYLQQRFRRATPDEQSYLRSFFATPQGKMFWEYALDGGGCAGLFQGLAQRKVMLTAEQRQTVAAWQSKFQLQRKEFESALGKLSAEQKAELMRASSLFSRLWRVAASDEAEFQESLVSSPQLEQALRRSAESVGPQVRDLAAHFKRTNPT